MKVIIIEGTDNVGKDTLISEIMEQFPISTVIHCDKPKGTTPLENEIQQNALFYNYMNRLVNGIYKPVTDVVIFNRAWYGEYVYGPLYRERSEESVKIMIDTIEEELNEVKQLEVYYIQLLSTSDKLIKLNDDGKSISEAQLEKIRMERKRFEEIFNYSHLNKKLIYVNDGDNFKSKETILNEALNFINK